MSIEHSLLHLGGKWAYIGIFLVLMAASLGLPLPEDIPLLASGVLVHKGMASLWLMIPVAMVGVLGGDCVLFLLGRKFGHRVVMHRFSRRVVNPSRLLVAERLFQRHGIKILFAGRFLPGLRPMIFMAAGVLKVPFRVFIAVNGFAACISVPTLVILGRVFGHSYERIKGDVRTATHGIIIALIVIGMIVAAILLHRRQKRLVASTGGQTEVSAETLADMPPQAPPMSAESPQSPGE